MAILIALPPGIAANQEATQNLTGNLGDVITRTQASINSTLTQIECSLTSSAPSNFGFSNAGTFISQGTGAMGSTGPSTNGPTTIFGGGPMGGGGSKPMNLTTYDDIANLSDVAAIEPILQVVEGHNQTITPHIITNGGPTPPPSTLQGFNITVPDYIIEGIPLNESLISNYPVLPTNISAGRNLQTDEVGSVLLSQNSSAYFNKGVGDTVTILGKDFKVVGIYSPTGVSDNQYVYMNLADAQSITNNTDTVTSLNVFAASKDTVSSVASAISSLHPELNVNTAQQRLSQLEQMQTMYDSQLKSAQSTMNQTQSQASIEIIIAISATSIIVLFVMLYTVRERTKEIGTLKAIGASNRTVMGQFLVEGILLSVVAGVVAVVIGSVAAPYLSSVLLPTVGHTLNSLGNGATVVSINSGATSATPAISVSPQYMLLGFGAAVLLGAIGSLYPSWRAAKTRPAEAMRHE